MSGDGTSGAQKRRAYLVWFCIAAGIEAVRGLFMAAPYRPSLIGLAIMITAALFFAYSWLRER